jgi:LysR family transcriptional activator of glutamate synthase operon
MELLQLKYFQIAAKTQNFSQAAEELNISQPSLSMTIAHLEDELDSKLFERKGRNVVLNESGTVFLARVNAIFFELENAKNEIMDISGKQSRRISLATTSPRLLEGVLKEFLLKYGDVVINQKCEMLENIEKQLQAGDIDFALTVPAIKGDNVECKILKDDEVVLIVPENHRCANKKSISLIEVAGDPFITLDNSYNFRKISDSICKSAGFTPNIEFEVNDSLMNDMLELQRGIALLPKYLIERPHVGKSHLNMLKIDFPDSQIQIGLSWRKQRYFSDAAKKFRNFMIEHYRLQF